MASDDDNPIDEAPPTGGVWALPMLALGLGLIACCLIIPAADDTRQVMFERERLSAEMESLGRQVALNEEFLERLPSDRELALRLASRQRTDPEEGVGIITPTWDRPGGGGLGNFAMSPFALVAAEPVLQPTAPTPAQGGRLAAFCREPRARLVVLGIGLFACMLGLLGGGTREQPADE
jgi:hypothetical protein